MQQLSMNNSIMLLATIIGIVILVKVGRLVIIPKIYGFKNISALDLNEQLKGSNTPVLIDVRTVHEYKEKHISDSINIPLDDINKKVEWIKSNQLEKNIVILCHSGVRSVKASIILKQNGLKNVYNLKGGIISWISYGFPIKN